MLKLSSINKTLLDFVGVDTIEEYTEKYSLVSDMFSKNENYFNSKDDSTWIEDISKLNSMDRIVKIKNKNNSNY